MRRLLFLFYQLSRRDISARYKGSLFGFTWSLITPLAMLAVYTFVFGEVFQTRWPGVPAGRVDFALNMFAGLVVHGLFAECLARSCGLIGQHGSYVRRVVFPLWLLAPVVVSAAVFHTFISLLVLLSAFLLFNGFLHWEVLLLPFLLMPVLVFCLGVIWLVSALSVFLRDINQMVPVIVTAMLFMAPVFYPVSALPEAYQEWLYLNPLTPSIEMVRAAVILGELPDWSGFLRGLGVSLVFAAGCLWVFNRLKSGFSDAL